MEAESGESAITHALGEYYVDFPNSETLANDNRSIEKLGGRNEKTIPYLKLEMLRRDVGGALLDPWGHPYLIKTTGAKFVVQSSDDMCDECGNTGERGRSADWR